MTRSVLSASHSIVSYFKCGDTFLCIFTDKQRRQKFGCDKEEQKNMCWKKNGWFEGTFTVFTVCTHARASTMQPPSTERAHTHFQRLVAAASSSCFFFVNFISVLFSLEMHAHTQTHTTRAQRKIETRSCRSHRPRAWVRTKKQNKYLTNGIESSVYILNTD